MRLPPFSGALSKNNHMEYMIRSGHKIGIVNKYKKKAKQIGKRAIHITMANVCNRRSSGIPRTGAHFTLESWSNADSRLCFECPSFSLGISLESLVIIS